jgi:hypothetical protein
MFEWLLNAVDDMTMLILKSGILASHSEVPLPYKETQRSGSHMGTQPSSDIICSFWLMCQLH